MIAEYQKWLDDLYEATKAVGKHPVYTHMRLGDGDVYMFHTESCRYEAKSLKELLEKWESWIVRQTGRGTGGKAPVVPRET